MRKRNALQTPLIAQADDAVFGSWGIVQRGAGAGTIYRYDGHGWVAHGSASWNAARGRFEMDAPLAVETRRGLNEAVLDQDNRGELTEYVSRLHNVGFRGTRITSNAETPVGVNTLALRSMQRSRCLSKSDLQAQVASTSRRQTGDENAICNAYLAADSRKPVDKSAATFRAVIEANLPFNSIDRRSLIARHVVEAPRGKAETLTPATVKLLNRLFAERYVAIERDVAGRTKWYRSLEGEALVARDVARAALRDVCDLTAGSVEPGSECDLTMDAIEQEREPTGDCAVVSMACPHRISADQRSEWRIGGMPALGPYETTERHAAGSISCCWYHPVSQMRLDLQSRIGANAETPLGSRPWIDAVRHAEQEHPLYDQWMACDLRAEKEVGGLPTGRGEATAGVMQLLKAFVQAYDADAYDEGLAIFGRLEPLTTLHSDFEEFWSLDAGFWDHAHLEAHDLGNPGYILWVHQQMKARGHNIHHARQAKKKRRN